MDDIAKMMVTILNESIIVAALAFWIIGIGAAKGGWLIALACVFPPAAWVFAAKHLLGM